MDCYISKRKYRCKNIIDKYTGEPIIIYKYQQVRLSFVFKNYKIKGKSIEQLIIFDIDLVFPANKSVIILNKNNLIRKIKNNYLESSIKYLNFSQFDTTYKSDKFKDVIDLKKLKIKFKEEDLEYIFKNVVGKTLIIDNKQKELVLVNCGDYFFSQLNFYKYMRINRSPLDYECFGYIAKL